MEKKSHEWLEIWWHTGLLGREGGKRTQFKFIL